MTLRKFRRVENNHLQYMLIVLFCMNFFGRGSIFCMVFALAALLNIPKKFAVDADMMYALLLCISSFFASFVYESTMEAVKCLNFFLLYFVGLNNYHAASNKILFVKRMLFAVFLGFAVGVLLVLYSSSVSQLFNTTQYWLPTSFWTGERIASTQVGLMSSVVIGYSFYGIVCQKRKGLKLLTIVSLLVILYLNLRTAARTPILLFAVVWLVMFSMYIADQRGKKAERIWFLSMFFLLLTVAAFMLDVAGMKSFVMNSPFLDRFIQEGFTTGRDEISMDYLALTFDFMWGGSHVYDIVGIEAHNFIQQGHDLYGIFASVALCLLELSFVKNVLKLIFRKNKASVDYLLISMYISMIFIAHLEPIFTGYPCYFFTLLMIHGLTNGYLRTNRAEAYSVRACL